MQSRTKLERIRWRSKGAWCYAMCRYWVRRGVDGMLTRNVRAAAKNGWRSFFFSLGIRMTSRPSQGIKGKEFLKK